MDDAREDDAAEVVIPLSVLERLHRAFGPIAGGLILDFADLLTFGPIGIFLGPVVGALVGWWVSSIYRFGTRGRLIIAALSAFYMTIPLTGFIPLATIISAVSRYREPSSEEPTEPKEVDAQVVDEDQSP